MNRNHRLSLSKKIVLALILATSIGAGAYYYRTYVSEGVHEYNAVTDKAFVVNLFKQDWYWLISDFSSKDYSVDHMLDNRAASKEESGNLIIKVYRANGIPVGFLAYYMKELFEGRLLFVAVDKTQRSKGYARKMVEYALNDLKKRGASVVRLITRTDNTAAQKLYKSMGFKEIWTDVAYMKFEKEL